MSPPSLTTSTVFQRNMTGRFLLSGITSAHLPDPADALVQLVVEDLDRVRKLDEVLLVPLDRVLRLDGHSIVVERQVDLIEVGHQDRPVALPAVLAGHAAGAAVEDR